MPSILTQAEGGDPLQTPCADMTESERRKTDRCLTDEERRAAEYERIQREREEREREDRTSFLKWVHLDGLWSTTDIHNRSYGVIGTHIAVMEFGRLYIYGPPGVMLIMERGEAGNWRARPGLTWGVSVHLTDVTFPGSQRRTGLYLNLAKLWTTGRQRQGTDMIGLSFTWGK